MTEDADLATELIIVTGRFTRLVTQLSGAKIPRAMWRMLAQLAEHGPMRVSQLAEIDRIAQPTATSLVQRLTRAGLVETSRDPADARATLVAISGAGLARLAELRGEVGGQVGERLAALTPGERDDLRRAIGILRRIT